MIPHCYAANDSVADDEEDEEDVTVSKKDRSEGGHCENEEQTV